MEKRDIYENGPRFQKMMAEYNSRKKSGRFYRADSHTLVFVPEGKDKDEVLKRFRDKHK